jgi:phosphatidylglycerol:prolipoprotein diacylglycerol transferase
MARRRPPDGQVFMLYLLLSGAARFAVEFLRLNSPVVIGLTEAQIIAAALAMAGVVGLLSRRQLSALTDCVAARRT